MRIPFQQAPEKGYWPCHPEGSQPLGCPSLAKTRRALNCNVMLNPQDLRDKFQQRYARNRPTCRFGSRTGDTGAGVFQDAAIHSLPRNYMQYLLLCYYMHRDGDELHRFSQLPSLFHGPTPEQRCDIKSRPSNLLAMQPEFSQQTFELCRILPLAQFRLGSLWKPAVGQLSSDGPAR